MAYKNQAVAARNPCQWHSWRGLLAIAALLGAGALQAQVTDFSGYNPNLNGAVYALALQPDGAALVGGNYTSVAGQAQVGIVRLLATGQADAGFAASVNTGSAVEAVAVQSDGQILIGGTFTSVDGATRSFLARLHGDGTVDSSFATAGAANGDVSAIALQPDGKILIGGSFTSYAGVTRNHIARLLADGSLDTGFSTGSLGVSSGVPTIEKFLVLPNGRCWSADASTRSAA